MAANSIVGYILGIGDRHAHNILIDSITGMYVCMYVCIYMCVYISFTIYDVCACMSVYVCMYVYMNANSYSGILLYEYMYKHIYLYS